jgi:hypothetical protein
MKPFTVFSFILSAALLAGCTRQVVTTNRNLVVMPPENMMVCNRVDLPDPRNISDIQIARLITRIYTENEQCHFNMAAIRQYLETARRETQQQ